MAGAIAWWLFGRAQRSADPDLGVPMMVWHGSALCLAMVFGGRPWQLRVRPDASHGRIRSAVRRHGLVA